MATFNVSEADFEAKVVNAGKPVLVDFWAPWCVDPATKILLEGGSQLGAKKITPGQNLCGINRSGLAFGQVTRSLIARDLGHCRKVTLVSGREIKVTDDHLFYGEDGWVAAKNLKPKDKLAVFPTPDASFRGQMADKELVVARLMGLLFTDGTLYFRPKNRYYEVSFSLGQKKDVDDVKRDLMSLGFNNVRSKRIVKTQEISGRKFITHIFKVKCLSKKLFELLRDKGVPVGAKKSQEYLVPDWIKKGGIEVKREFLRGFLGGDGPKVSIRMANRPKRLPYNKVDINDLEFHKDPSFNKSGLKLARELKELLSEFGVKVIRIFSEEDSYVRKDGQKSAIIHIVFRNDFETAFNLATKVGYAYAWQKESTSLLASEFLRQIMRLRNKWQSLYEEALKLASSGLGYRRISRALGINPLRVYLWIKGKAKATVAQHKLKFDTWKKQALSGAPAGFIWEEIEEIKPTFLPSVAKITVAKTESFIGNGILCHNCGPCKMAEPVLEELAEAFAGRVEIAKLNVDENPNLSMKLGVMSIPTTILFKDAKEVGRQIGFSGKQAFEDLIIKGIGPA